MTYKTSSNQSGDLSELKVKTEIIERGWLVNTPDSRDAPYDFVVDRGEGIFERVQVKTMCGNMLTKRVNRNGSSVSNGGKTRNSIDYAELGIDWLAGYQRQTGKVFFYRLENYSKIPTNSFSVNKWPADDFPVWEPPSNHSAKNS